MSNLKRTITSFLALSLLGAAAGPHLASAQSGTKTYEVTITNIANGMQAFSPPIIATHPTSIHAWQLGTPASPGIEKIAEDGMSDVLASELQGKATSIVASKAHLLPGNAALNIPGDSITLTITANDGDVLSYANMLVQTNDGFAGADSIPLTDGTTDVMAYDAGTEDNTEAKTDVPGPPFGGKSDLPDTKPHAAITAHTGIIGKADVTPDFNWTGPVARISIRTITPTTPTSPTYDITITNITNSMQGLSPMVIATHPASAHAWQMGQTASAGLELLAEEGNPSNLATELKAAATDIVTTSAHLLPGDSITVRVKANPGDVVSAATMLIQTNDGFTGLSSAALTDGNTDTNAYDAGTEDNTERKTDVPGPPFGGHFSGPNTSPRGTISNHPNIAGTADITPDFKWSGAVARFTIQTVSGSASATSAPATAVPAATSPAVSATSTTTSGTMPSMPKTGGPNPTTWLIVLIAAASAILGLALRRPKSTQR